MYPEIFSELKGRLGNWFLNVLQEGYALLSPEFKINKDESMILGYAPFTISSLTNTGFYLTGWENNMQSATYSVDIERDGKYALEADFAEITSPFLLEATIGDASDESLIENNGKSLIGVFTPSKNHEILTLKNAIK